MTKFPATEAKNRFGEVLEAAFREPVEISKKGRPVAVVLSMETYTRMREQLESLARPTDLAWLREWRKDAATDADRKPLDEADYREHLEQKYGQ